MTDTSTWWDEEAPANIDAIILECRHSGREITDSLRRHLRHLDHLKRAAEIMRDIRELSEHEEVG